MSFSISRALWPYPRNHYSTPQRLRRSLAKRLTRVVSLLDGYDAAIPDAKSRKAARAKYEALATTYFEDPTRTGLHKVLENAECMGANVTDYYFLHAYIKSRKPTRAIEMGSGITTYVMSQALRELNESDPGVSAGHLDTMEHLAQFHEETKQFVPDDQKPFVDFHLEDAVIKNWLGRIPGTCYKNLPTGTYQFAFIDGPPADDYPNGDQFELIARATEPMDIVIDKRMTTVIMMDRHLKAGKVFFDYALELGFAVGVTRDDLLRSPRITRPIQHADIFETLGADTSLR